MALATLEEKAFPEALTFNDKTRETEPDPAIAAKACTKAVVAICWLLSEVSAVGAVGIPVRAGLAKLRPATFVYVPPKDAEVDPSVNALDANWSLVIPAVNDKFEVVKPDAETDPAMIEIPEPAVNGLW